MKDSVVVPKSSVCNVYEREHLVGIKGAPVSPENFIADGVENIVLGPTKKNVSTLNVNYVSEGSTWRERLECSLFQGNSTVESSKTISRLRLDLERALRKGEGYRSLSRKLKLVLGVN
uniref:Uncharacterized protein n=1 Tax=Mucochytrium quahogii TaxID=96639 RepID=A0A7S2R982_9STRA|mmetsp:Transcript_18207/g.29595  ORF Transcript_18207/g.29595 Transcript_18207/m.29595 type:complete len:118 (-) Transcript_18207:185-538(-)